MGALDPSDTTTSRVRVLIVDDHELFADAVAAVLTAHGFEVLGVATRGEEAVDRARGEAPDLVLMDSVLPDVNGSEVGRKILELHPNTMVVIVMGFADATLLREALANGFHGVLAKDSGFDQFVKALDRVLHGQVAIPHELARAAAGFRSAEEREAELRLGQLTTRERQVLDLMVEGAGTGEIASRLSLSVTTVRTHAQNILTKLGVRSRLEAVAFVTSRRRPGAG